jgi:hypothetical protein
MSKEKSQNTHPSVNEEEKNLEILRLKQQVAINLWIQAFAQFSEAIATTKLFFLEEQEPGSQEILHGVWIQVIGQFAAASGVTLQLLVTDNLSLLKAQRIATLGDWIQSIGGAVEGVGGEKSIQHFISEELIP